MIRAKHTLNTNSSDWIQNPAVPPVSDLILCDIYACLTDEYVPLLDSEKLTGFIVFIYFCNEKFILTKTLIFLQKRDNEIMKLIVLCDNFINNRRTESYSLSSER